MQSYIFKLTIFIFLLIFVCVETNQLGRNDYEYILPTRKVTSCPSFASFRFSCQPDHVIGIDSLIFAPALTDRDGDCMPDHNAECFDNDDALAYAQQECSNSEHCTLISYQLRAQTKCQFHSVISVLYKCVPTWEVMDVPIKCDICKNITITNTRDNYGFIHSAWYPKLYPRVTCHSLIKNQPDKLIVIYSVSGSIGLDRIQIESVDDYGQLRYRETLTGNITTKRILVSAFDVNITVLPEDAYFFDQRRFLFYFYLVPRCHVIHCPLNNVTHFPPILSTTTPIIIDPITMAPPLKGTHNTSKISDAWLAAILALIYSLLMVIAVLTAIYCRRRRRQQLLKRTSMYSERGTAASSSAQIIPAMSRIPSQTSLREHTRSVTNPVYLTTPNVDYDLYAQMEREQREQYQYQQQQQFQQQQQQFQQQQQQFQQQQHQQQQQIDNGTASVKITRNIPIITKENDFDNISYTVHDDNRAKFTETNTRHERIDFMEQNAMYQRSQFNETINTPYAIKTNTNVGSIVGGSATGMSQYSNDSLKGIYRAVEYTKSPRVERVRVKNSEDNDDFDTQQMGNLNIQSRNYRIDTREVPVRVTDLENGEINHLQYRTTNTITNEGDEKTFVVKLFPVDEHEKEVQEMTMFVESNEHHSRKY